MAIRSSLPTFAIFLFLLCVTLVANASNNPDEEIDVRLAVLNNRAVIAKTLVSPYGDVVDCVPSLLQPAFSHPSMKGKKLLIPKELQVRRCGSANGICKSSVEHQESCPRGTIPIRRITRNKLSRTSKTTSAVNYSKKIEVQPSVNIDGFIHEYATGTQAGDGSYYGTKATINVWSPYVSPHNDFSLAQIWVTSGGYNTNLETIEVGWQVSPELYGDNNPRLFTYWTADSYNQTGCYDLQCPGFVQTNNLIVLGNILSPTSIYGGKQTEITIQVWKNNKDGNWWLSVQGEVVGYWPTTLFRSPFTSATTITFGGEVAYLPSANHTKTDMGSGRFPDEGFKEAAYFRGIETLDINGTAHPVSSLTLAATRQECYTIAGGFQSDDWGQYFFYGGGGQSELCR